MRTINYITAIFAIAASTAVQGAQADTLRSFPSLEKREIQKSGMQWENTTNAAGMNYGSVDKGSYTTLGIYNGAGDYHRVQEGSEKRGLLFETERYDKLNDKIFVKGTFSFNMDKEFDKGWSDVYNPYNNNPFIYGSSVRGTYETQKFDLGLRAYTKYKSRFNYGLSIDYKVADIARQRDPRSRSYHLDYSVKPAVVFEIGKKHTAGLNLSYRFGKEKMPGLTTIQTDPNLKYYTFTGLEHAEGKIGGYKGFSRQFLSDYYGEQSSTTTGERRANSLSRPGLMQDGKRRSATFARAPVHIMNSLTLFWQIIKAERGNMLHNLRAEAVVRDGGADEFRQER